MKEADKRFIDSQASRRLGLRFNAGRGGQSFGSFLEQLPTIVLVGLAMFGVAEPANIEFAMACSWFVIVVWICRRWTPSPVAMALNLHLAIVPLLLMASDTQAPIPLRERIIENVFPTVTAAAALGSLWGLWSAWPIWPIWRRALVAVLAFAAIPWAVQFGDSRLLAVGVPAICLGFLVGRRQG